MGGGRLGLVFLSKGKINVHRSSLRWLEAVLCLPMYGKSPDGLYTSILHRLLPLSYPVRSVSDHPVMGGNGLSRPGGNLGLRV